MTFSKKAGGGVKWETWTMGDGTVITVDQMTEQHAKNTLNLLLKRNKSIQRNLEILKATSKEFRDIIGFNGPWDDKNWM